MDGIPQSEEAQTNAIRGINPEATIRYARLDWMQALEGKREIIG